MISSGWKTGNELFELDVLFLFYSYSGVQSDGNDIFC